VGTDLKSVWLVATPTASVMTPTGERQVQYSETKVPIPLETIQFRTYFEGPRMGGPLVARVSISDYGVIENSIERDEIPNGTIERCRKGYLTLLRDGFVSFVVDMRIPMLISVQQREKDAQS